MDVGTSGCKAIAYDRDGGELATSRKSYRRVAPEVGWSEIRPSDLTSAVDYVIGSVASQTRRDPIEAMCFSVFGGSFVPVDADGQPLYNIIATTDSRPREDAEAWARAHTRERTYRITGLSPHSSFPLVKAIAFRRLYPDLYERAAKLVTAEELLMIHLGLPAIVDRATASTYMAYDLEKGDWSEEILAAAGISRDRLPEIADCGSVIGLVTSTVAERLGIPKGTPVVAGGHDQQVASFGAGLTRSGRATDSLGTAEAISIALKPPMPKVGFLENNIPIFCHVCGGLLFSCVYSFSCADLLNWAMRVFHGAKPGAETSVLKEALSRMPEEPSRMLVLPHFCGSGTPYMDSASRGAIVGLDLNATPEEVLRAIVDCQNYEMRLNIDIWHDLGIKIDRLRAYGGAAQSDRLLQIKADVLDLEVVRLECHEAGCFGAAVLAGHAVGRIDDCEEFLTRTVREKKMFLPRKEMTERHESSYQVYRQLYPAVAQISHLLVGGAH